MSKSVILPESSLPAHLKGVSDSDGRLTDETQILSPPRLKLVQGNTPELAEGKAKAGEYWSDAHAQCLGPEVHVIPLRFEVEWMEFHPQGSEETGVKWRTQDPNDPNVLACGEEAYKRKRLNMLCLAPIGVEGLTPKPEVFSFHGNSMPGGRDLYDEAARARETPIQSQVWKLTSGNKPGPNKSTIYFAKGRFAGHANEALFTAAKEIYREFADRALVPDYEDSGDPQPAKGKSSEEDELPF